MRSYDYKHGASNIEGEATEGEKVDCSISRGNIRNASDLACDDLDFDDISKMRLRKTMNGCINVGTHYNCQLCVLL